MTVKSACWRPEQAIIKNEAVPRVELGLSDSESDVITTTLHRHDRGSNNAQLPITAGYTLYCARLAFEVHP